MLDACVVYLVLAIKYGYYMVEKPIASNFVRVRRAPMLLPGWWHMWTLHLYATGIR